MAPLDLHRLIPEDSNLGLSLPQCATLACLLEATTPKAGNVHRGADFEDLTFVDFVVSAVAVSEAIAQAAEAGVGAAALKAVASTRHLVRTNTNLGTLLLLAPLAAVPLRDSLQSGIATVLSHLGTDDAANVYAAIRLAHPGGLGSAERMDVSGAAPASLLDAMREAAGRDLVARQYTNDFAQVFGVASQIADLKNQGWPLTDAIVHAHLQLMADFPDSLIARKCGPEQASTAARMAGAVLACGSPTDPGYRQLLADLDFWLRSDGHRRNPGTSADLIAAGLFVALREQRLKPPLR
jgi:triphosphoribosyl-dephospho-CoA synthase